MIKTSAGRALASAFFIGFVLDLSLAYILASLSTEREFWFWFFALLAVLWIAPLAFGLKSVLYKTFFYFLKRGSIRRALVQEFRKAELPLTSGTDFNSPADLYFEDVAQDDSLPKSARLFAAQTTGQLALVPTYSSADTFILHANLDAALATYFDDLLGRLAPGSSCLSHVPLLGGYDEPETLP